MNSIREYLEDDLVYYGVDLSLEDLEGRLLSVGDVGVALDIFLSHLLGQL